MRLSRIDVEVIRVHVRVSQHRAFMIMHLNNRWGNATIERVQLSGSGVPRGTRNPCFSSVYNMYRVALAA